MKICQNLNFYFHDAKCRWNFYHLKKNVEENTKHSYLVPRVSSSFVKLRRKMLSSNNMILLYKIDNYPYNHPSAKFNATEGRISYAL